LISRYSEYLSKLKTNFAPAIKIDWLNADDTVQFEITNDYVDMSGTLSINMNNGTRRTCELTVDNTDGQFPVSINNVWYAQKIKLWMGLYLDDGEPYYFPQGVFYISSVSENNSPSIRTVTFQCVDKWAFLDGSLFGSIEGIYIVPLNTNIYSAISGLLNTSRFTGAPLTGSEPRSNAVDFTPPMYNSYYLTKKYVTSGGTYDAIKTPYEIRMEPRKTYADIILEFATMLGAYVYYDVDGRLTIEPTQDDISDTSKPILWTFTPEEQEFLAEESKHDFTTWYNDVIVIGYIINGKQANGRAQNRNLSSQTCIQMNGIKTKEPFQNTAYYTNEQCNELARYYLKQLTIKQRSATITSAPIYHLRENRLIDCVRPYTFEQEPMLISGISIPIGTIGSMSISATSINEFVFA
jgi:hypothetical protein